MQRLISEGIVETLDMKDLQMALPRDVRVVRYDELLGKKTFKAVMGRFKALILLWNVHDKRHRLLDEPGHFFVLTTWNDKPYVFSSTGMKPRKELFLTQSDPDLFDRILPENVAYNSKKLQGNGNSNTCWRYCLLFCHLVVRGRMKPQEFSSRLSRPLHLHTSDQIVTGLTFASLFSEQS